ncbi:hypothetical protein BN2476_2190002 [Paraburkholderia piptadeniae]|uniref:Uncharacterized protein n=1 Tax=Paraburkholderia piptadeniae TaxID=1701573 RepID=A0A1N7SZ28_9BURK|nr:hypothetical protein BN2476_2190002 [Paraburkholderia piptadeniae]
MSDSEVLGVTIEYAPVPIEEFKQKMADRLAEDQSCFTQQSNDGACGGMKADHQVLHKGDYRQRRMAVFKIFEQALNLVGRNVQPHAL